MLMQTQRYGHTKQTHAHKDKDKSREHEPFRQ
jgi:hypothetical protein